MSRLTLQTRSCPVLRQECCRVPSSRPAAAVLAHFRRRRVSSFPTSLLGAVAHSAYSKQIHDSIWRSLEWLWNHHGCALSILVSLLALTPSSDSLVAHLPVLARQEGSRLQTTAPDSARFHRGSSGRHLRLLLQQWRFVAGLEKKGGSLARLALVAGRLWGRRSSDVIKRGSHFISITCGVR